MTPDAMMIRLARRACLDPHFFAHVLGPDTAAVAARLGCPERRVVDVYLCPVPGDEEGVRRIAAKFDVDAEALAAMWREGRGQRG